MIVWVILATVEFPEPPFSAWVNVESANVRFEPSSRSPPVGVLQLGDEVSVAECVPHCLDGRAWALLTPFGAIKLSSLATTPSSDMALAQSAGARFVYGSIRQAGAALYLEPDIHACVVREEKPGRVLAFRDDPLLLDEGWLRLPRGGFVRLADVRLANPSPFSGERDPRLPLAFIFRGPSRFARAPVLAVSNSSVTTELGEHPRSDVRLVRAQPRPKVVGEADKWVYLDVQEQTLTAYEGDVPVFATLVSSGKSHTATKTGLFRVWSKVIHASMEGHGDPPYFVDEVPFSLFFHRDMAIHGAFWHDHFGERVSHGCVNLSMTDAAWLFAWAPPELPLGWHSVVASVPDLPALWVLIR